MKWNRVLLALIPLAILIAIPLFFTDGRHNAAPAGRFIVVITPHNEFIRGEFERGFRTWHMQQYGEPVDIEWDIPGGTSEIKKLLEKSHRQALLDGASSIQTDVFFGGGSFEYTDLAGPFPMPGATAAGEPVLAIAPLAEQVLAEAFPSAELGGRRLYSEDKRWFASAISTFGIVFNPQRFEELKLPAPSSWADLADPRLEGWVAMTNPSQSGSVLTAFETIVLRRGWADGWAILLRAGANARTFSGSSSEIPKRVSAGACAAGVCIDFFARAEAQIVNGVAGSDGARVAFVAPRGETVVDPDPVAVLSGAREPELAAHFVEFCLSRQGQALWQFRKDAIVGGLAPPVEWELRRMPARREMYEQYSSAFVDQDIGNPFVDASPLPERRYVRPLIKPIFSALVIQPRELQQSAWRAITRHPSYPRAKDGDHAPLVTAADVTDKHLYEWLRLFDMMPTVPGPGGREYSLATEEGLQAVHAGWIKRQWADSGLWEADEEPEVALRRLMTQKAIERYTQIIEGARAIGIEPE